MAKQQRKKSQKVDSENPAGAAVDLLFDLSSCQWLIQYNLIFNNDRFPTVPPRK